jgi:MFS family permease
LRLVTAAPDSAPAPGRLPYSFVFALGAAQLVAWGSFYYVFVTLMEPMAAELGWSKTAISGALSVVLATNGLCTYGIGRWIDRFGGRLLMTLAAFLGAGLLILWSQVAEIWQFYVLAVGIGVISSMLLYESAFAVVARLMGADYRRAIIVITLLGGLASTAFVPLTHYLVVTLGWRQALVALAFIQLPICAGIPFFLLRGRESFGRGRDSAAPFVRVSIKPALAHPVFWLLAVSFVSYAFLFTSLVFSLVPILGERGYTAAEAVAAYACIGPFQLAGRFVILTFERQIGVVAAGLIGTLFPVLATLILMTLEAHSPLVFVFAIAFGIGMGVKTIVQATAAPEFLGRAAYGALQGALMFPVYFAQAVSPFFAAAIWQIEGDYGLLQIVLIAMAALSAAAFILAAKLRPGREALLSA